MAGSLNKVTLIGNLGADPEVRTMGNGKSGNGNNGKGEVANWLLLIGFLSRLS